MTLIRTALTGEPRNRYEMNEEKMLISRDDDNDCSRTLKVKLQMVEEIRRKNLINYRTRKKCDCNDEQDQHELIKNTELKDYIRIKLKLTCCK